jgi:hypothetical protein
LFLHCLLKANYIDKPYRGIIIKRGTFVTSFEVLSAEIGLSIQQLRTASKKLESTGEINRRSTTQGTILSVCNYDVYQEEEPSVLVESNGQSTFDQPKTNGQSTTTKNYKKLKKEKNQRIEPPKLSDVKLYFKESGKISEQDLIIESENFLNFYSDLNWKNKAGKHITEWRRQASSWANNYIKFNRKKNDKWGDPF